MRGVRRRVVFGLGSNLGDREALLCAAANGLRTLPGVTGSTVSSLYETEPVGGPPQGRYLNAALLVVTDEEPEELLRAAARLEQEHGRVRRERNGPRTLDIDVLWIEDEVVDLPLLQVPHPRMHERAFALLPLLEVAPDARDPRTGRLFGERVPALDTRGVVRVAGPERLEGSTNQGVSGAWLDTPGRKC